MQRSVNLLSLSYPITEPRDNDDNTEKVNVI